MKKILLVTPKLTYPPAGGSEIRTQLTISALSRAGISLGVLGINARAPKSPPIDSVDFWHTVPDELAPNLEAEGGDLNWMKIPEWRPSDLFYNDAAGDALKQTVTNIQPNVIILDTLMAGSYYPIIENSNSVLILNAHNVKGDLQRQLEKGEKTSMGKLVRRKFSERMAKLEGEIIKKVARVWTCSVDDRDLIVDLFGDSTPIDVVPNVVDLDPFDDTYKSQPKQCLGDPPLLTFTAFFGVSPNLTAAMFLINELYPSISSAIPGTEITLVGRSPSEQMRTAAEKATGITVTGFVPEIAPYIANADAMLVPLFEGSGMRTKVLQAFAAGRPVVATPKAVEGIEVVDGKHVLLAETAEEFVVAIKQLQDPEIYRTLVGNARALAESSYSLEALTTAIEKSLDATELNLSTQTGTCLQSIGIK